MQPVVNKPAHLLTWMVGTSVIVFCLVGIAALTGWIPTPFDSPADNVSAGRLSATPTSSVAPKAHRGPALVAEIAVMRERCADCGVVESIRAVDTPGDTSVLGVVGGAVVGGVLGHQVGGGRGKDLATVAGAVGGAVAGNEIEKQVRSSKSYETTVRFDDGSTRVFSEAGPPQWRTGDWIKVIDGVIRLHG